MDEWIGGMNGLEGWIDDCYFTSVSPLNLPTQLLIILTCDLTWLHL